MSKAEARKPDANIIGWGPLGVVLIGEGNIILLHSISIISWTELHFVDKWVRNIWLCQLFKNSMLQVRNVRVIVEPINNFAAGAWTVNCSTGKELCTFIFPLNVKSRIWKGLRFPFVIILLILLISDSQPSFPDDLGFSNYLKLVKKSFLQFLL